jgi:hypothetical protein
MSIFRKFRSLATWRDIAVVVVISGTVILASMALVSYRNRHREARSTEVAWAIEALAAVSADTIATAFDPTEYADSLRQFRQNVNAHTLTVDSVRTFYHAYALCARDGSLAPQEIADLGRFFGLRPADPLRVPPPVEDTLPNAPAETNTTTGGTDD